MGLIVSIYIFAHLNGGSFSSFKHTNETSRCGDRIALFYLNRETDMKRFKTQMKRFETNVKRFKTNVKRFTTKGKRSNKNKTRECGNIIDLFH